MKNELSTNAIELPRVLGLTYARVEGLFAVKEFMAWNWLATNVENATSVGFFLSPLDVKEVVGDLSNGEVVSLGIWNAYVAEGRLRPNRFDWPNPATAAPREVSDRSIYSRFELSALVSGLKPIMAVGVVTSFLEL